MAGRESGIVRKRGTTGQTENADGGDDEAVPWLALEPAPDNGFRGAIGLGPGRDGVHFGGVDEVDAVGQGAIELGVGVGFVGLLAEGHGAEAEIGNVEGAGAKAAGGHGGLPGGCGGLGRRKW